MFYSAATECGRLGSCRRKSYLLAYAVGGVRCRSDVYMYWDVSLKRGRAPREDYRGAMAVEFGDKEGS